MLAGATIGRLDAAARLILRDADQAQDAVQETLTRCWRDLPTLRDPERFEAWLNLIFLNACRDQQRRAGGRRIEVSLPEALPYTVPDGQSATSDRDQVERGIRRLAPEHRTILVLHYLLAQDRLIVGAVWGRSPGTTPSHIVTTTFPRACPTSTYVSASTS